ncbi:type IX secretion system plug protein [Salinimicrobium sediminilitoris]|uniref:type IX secretion system plug protein n=1 Tax=Salinimicrobium sediminilitoris TaxID=2876715 RepID=UPI001E3DC717|nr:DUF5103 domain-containing protein [Salinimicrobium sediminilitoris]MCC8358288.1 DUF5103 domain-containing protein [Salinimicrobium sediminilitoris]
MKLFFTLSFLIFSGIYFAAAQQIIETTPPTYIRTVIFTGAEEYSGVPIVRLGEPIFLSFDDLVGDEANYYYTIEHFNYDWTPSELLKNEYLEGFDNVRITDYENSFNTLQLYSHYELNIPNENTRGLKVSGNYLLKIFNDNKELVFSRKFIVYEPLTRVKVDVRKSREVKLIHSQQLVNFEVHAPEFIIRTPEQSVWAVILQNNNLKTAIYNIRPQYHIGSTLIYKYDELTSFWGGNEFLNFDSKDLRSATVKIQYIDVQDLYHHYLFPDKIRAFEPYTYNPDINGKFVVRKFMAEEDDIEAGYVWTHFSLRTPEPLEGGEVHLYGEFNNFNLDESTRLKYNPETSAYENARLFKQGYYDYKYVYLRNDGILDEGFISGNFVSTENDYTVLIYYLPPGGRYTRVIGVGNATSLNISN